MKKFNLGDAPVEVFCDRDKSFRVVDTRTMKTVALIPCDRSDLHDNARGLAIAAVVEAAINAQTRLIQTAA